ncbi:MAG: YkgJ family cysteine cluster protein [Sandaracinaceae bacterium]
MSEARFALGSTEDTIAAAAHRLGWRLLSAGERPRRLVYGGDGWQARFTIGEHVDVSAHDVDGWRRALEAEVGGELVRIEVDALESMPIARPRLRDTVRARILKDQGDDARVLLHDVESRAHVEIDVPTWRVVRAADGTRDRDGLALATGELASRIDALEEGGWLADGVGRSARAVLASTPRPVERLPDYAFVCDGRGACCEAYGSVPFTVEEAARASRTARAPADEALRFTPYGGAADHLAVALHDGACAFLDADGACGVHAELGARAKPIACQIYPATFVDDGVTVRASVAPECACVFASARRDREKVKDPFEPDPIGPVPSLVDPVPLSELRTASRDAFRAFNDRLIRAIERAPDPARWLAAVADRVSESGLDASLDGEAPVPRPDERALIRLRELADHPANALLSRRVIAWALDAARSNEATLGDIEAERFYLRALAFGYRLAREGRPLDAELRERAARIGLARRMSGLPAPDPRLASYPLGALEAALRHVGARLR